MKVFLLIWFGQVISLIGSGLTDFALGVWVYQQTQSATQYTLIAVCTILPVTLFSPFTGVVADQFNRKWVMILGDILEACGTTAIALLLWSDHLEIWHIYVANAVSATGTSFRFSAYRAAVPLLISGQDLGRANGLLQLGQALSPVITPTLAGVLMVSIGISKIIALDLATFGFAVVVLLLIRFPPTPRSSLSKTEKQNMWGQMAYAWHYLHQNTGLLALAIYFTVNDFLINSVTILFTPLVLSFTSASVLGRLLSTAAIGMILGSVIISWKAETQKCMNIVFGFAFLSGLCIFSAGLRASALLLTLTAFIFFFSLPFVRSFTQIIFQLKVPLDLQGRIFGFNQVLSSLSTLTSYILAGPLADGIFEPLMHKNGLLSSSIGQLIGVGPGRGIGLLFIIAGLLIMGVTIMAYQYSPLRFVERQIPNATP